MNKLYDLLFNIITALNSAVKTKTQTLTEAQKTQARANIGALGEDYVPPHQTAEQVGADPKGTAADLIGKHDVSTTAHKDIRDSIDDFKDRVNALLDSDDTTLDQLSEIVEYIKANKDLIESVTTAKVDVDDIVNDLESNITNQPLSAAQGVVLKGLIDNIRDSIASTPILTESEIDTLSAMIQ